MTYSQDSPYNTLWQHHFPFEYWYNRLEKINPHNDADRLESLYSLVELTEIYSRVFSAVVQNLNHPWYYLHEHIRVSDVEVAFDVLQTEGNTAVGRVSGDSDEIATVDVEDELKIDEIDAITAGLLGVPYEIDAGGSVQLLETPALHRDVCETILYTAERQASLHRCFNRGFTVHPVSPDTVETVLDSAGMVGEEDREPFQNQMGSLREQCDKSQWPLTFAQLDRRTTDEGEVCQVNVFHVDAWTCYKFAEVVLDALFNLITPGPGIRLQDSLSDVPAEVFEEGAPLTKPIMGFETSFRGQLVRVVTEEHFERSGQ